MVVLCGKDHQYPHFTAMKTETGRLKQPSSRGHQLTSGRAGTKRKVSSKGVSTGRSAKKAESRWRDGALHSRGVPAVNMHTWLGLSSGTKQEGKCLSVVRGARCLRNIVRFLRWSSFSWAKCPGFRKSKLPAERSFRESCRNSISENQDSRGRGRGAGRQHSILSTIWAPTLTQDQCVWGTVFSRTHACEREHGLPAARLETERVSTHRRHITQVPAPPTNSSLSPSTSATRCAWHAQLSGCPAKAVSASGSWHTWVTRWTPTLWSHEPIGRERQVAYQPYRRTEFCLYCQGTERHISWEE